jgi:Subtilase family
MRKLTIWIVVMLLLATTMTIAPMGGSLATEIEEYEARVSTGLQMQLDKITSSETVSAIVWADTSIDTILDGMKISGQVVEYSTFDQFNCYLVTVTSAGFDKLKGLKAINRMEENYTMTLPELIASDDDEEKSNWGLEDLGIPELWDAGIDGEGILIGILDSGIDGEHPEFEGRIDKFASFEMSGAIIEDEEPFDTYGHGTHCSGIIAGSTTGVAPKAHLMVGAVMPTGQGTFAQVIAGMNWILDPDSDPETDDAPKVVSMSLGGAIDEDMVEIADTFERMGVLLIASIGNSGVGTSGSPGNIPSVLAVGAYDSDRFCADFSSGTIIDWEYEPYHLTVTKPDVSAPGVAVYSAYPGGEYRTFSGTSMAAPHVAGVTALLLSDNPKLSNITLREALINTAEDLGDPGWDTRFGNGIIDPNSANGWIESSQKIEIKVSGDNEDSPINMKINDRKYRLDGSTSFNVPAGEKTNVELSCFGYERFSDVITPTTGADSIIYYDLVKLPVSKYSGSILSNRGNPAPGLVTFLDTPIVIETDKDGYFEYEVPVDTYTVKFWGIGCEPKTLEVDMADPPTRVELKETDVLVVIPQFKTPSKYHSRKYDSFCYRALDEIDLSYCPINPFDYKLSIDDLNRFDRVFWFGGPSDMEEEHSELLMEYLDGGGKLLLSASNLLLYDSYSGYSDTEPLFISDYFGLKSIRQGYYTTTLVGMEDTELGEGLVLALSGGDGASSQIGFDAFGINEKSPHKVRPFLHYLGPGSVSVDDLGYAGVSVESGYYAGIYLSFGFEVVNNKKDRMELLGRIEKWFSEFGGVDMTFLDADDKPVYSRVSVKNVVDGIESDEDGHVKLSSLRAGKYELDVSPYGFKKQSFEIEVTSGREQPVQLWLADPMKINFVGRIVDGDSKEPIECDFKVTGFETTTYSTDAQGYFDLSLPMFEYTVKFHKKRYLHNVMDIGRNDKFSEDDPMDIMLYRYKEKFAVVEQLHPSWAVMSHDNWFFQGLAQNYDGLFGKVGYKPTKLIIPPGNKISLEDVDQFETIIWLTGYNDELSEDWLFDVISEYIQGGGNLILIGNTVPTQLGKNPELARLLGFELVENNSWIFSIEGVKDDPIGDGILISKYHPYIRNRLRSFQASMKPIGEGVSCFNLIGGDSAGIWVKNDRQRTVVLGFDMFDMFDDIETHMEMITRMLNFVTE